MPATLVAGQAPMSMAQILVAALALPVVAWVLARILRIDELLFWRPFPIRDRHLRSLSQDLHAKIVRAGGDPMPCSRRPEDQELLVTAAATLARCRAEPTVVRAVLDEFAENLIMRRRRARRAMLIAASVLPVLGLSTLLSDTPRQSALSQVEAGGRSAIWGPPVAVLGYLVATGLFGIAIIRRADRTDHHVFQDVEVIGVLSDLMSTTGSPNLAATEMARRLGPTSSDRSSSGAAQAA